MSTICCVYDAFSTRAEIPVINTPDYRESYANSVQIRVNLWDFFLMFGTVNQTAPDSVTIHNFQGVYVSPAAGQGPIERTDAERFPV